MASSRTGQLVGAQRPRVVSRPPRVDSLGAEAIEFAASVGLILDPWQQLVVDDAFAIREGGTWAAYELGLLVARQNGKGGALEAIELAGLFLFGDKLTLHSAHEFKTAAEAFLRVKTLVDGSDELTRMVNKMRTSHGEEGIELHNGCRLRFVARSKSSGRGFSGDRVILDEAQELSVAAMAALQPTLSARPNPQIIYTGTVPDVTNDAEHWTSVRDRGRAGDDPALAWLEWSPEPPDGDMRAATLDYDLDDPAAWVAGNPALGRRITTETIERELRTMRSAPEAFARERLCIWPDSKAGKWKIITAREWDDTHDAESLLLDPVVLAIDVSPDRASATIAAAAARDDGEPHIEVVDRQPGTDWVVERVESICGRSQVAALVVDPAGPAGALLADLQISAKTLDVDIVTTSYRDVAQACGAFVDAVKRGGVWHLDQPALTEAVAAARKRTLGDAFAWKRAEGDDTDISPLVAVTLALWGHATAPLRAKKKRTGRVW